VAAGQTPISDAELEVLKVLWEQGPGTVRLVNAVLQGRGRRRAYTTVQTLLLRLEAKGYVRSNKGAPAHVFEAAVSRERLLSQRLRDLADQLCGGTASPLLLALVEGGRFTAEELEEFRRLLDRLDPPRAGRPRPGRGPGKPPAPPE
jgi:predicted transcriptional regulator